MALREFIFLCIVTRKSVKKLNNPSYLDGLRNFDFPSFSNKMDK